MFFTSVLCSKRVLCGDYDYELHLLLNISIKWVAFHTYKIENPFMENQKSASFWK